jgi:hypothetical protein
MMDAITTVLKELGVTKHRAVRDFALLNASQKAAEFAQEIEAFEKKYRMPFVKFQNKLQSRDEEIFEEENDLLAWKFAVDGVAYWREKVEQLKRKP